MDDLKESIGLSSYAQKDPLNQYRIASADLFDEMINNIQQSTARMILSVKKSNDNIRRKEVNHVKSYNNEQRPVINNSKIKKVGPNDLCPCGSGKKYKKCHGIITVGPQINETLNVGFDFFPDILGCILFYIALKKLSPYSKKFFISKYIVLTMSVPSILTLFSQVMIFFKNKPNFYYNIYETAEYIKYPIQFVFHVFLFLGIIELSKDVGIKSIVLRSIISLIISSFYFVAGMYLIFTQNVIFSNQIYNIIVFFTTSN